MLFYFSYVHSLVVHSIQLNSLLARTRFIFWLARQQGQHCVQNINKIANSCQHSRELCVCVCFVSVNLHCVFVHWFRVRVVQWKFRWCRPLSLSMALVNCSLRATLSRSHFQSQKHAFQTNCILHYFALTSRDCELVYNETRKWDR